jgi:chemotaxis protein histidine kinase CheA
MVVMLACMHTGNTATNMSADKVNDDERTVTFRVKAGYELPVVYSTGHISDIQEALTLGALVQEHVQCERSSEVLREYAARKEAEITALKLQLVSVESAMEETRVSADRSAAQARLEQTAAVREARKTEREEVLKEAAERVSAAEKQLETIKNRAEAAEERRRLVEIQRDTDIKMAEERIRATMQQIIHVREEQISESRQSLAALEDLYRKNNEEIRGLNDFLRRKTVGSSTKGLEYEWEFRELLVRAFGAVDRFALNQTARNGVGHAGDFLMRMRDHLDRDQTVLWEVKNYNRPVPRSEVEKFQRDMKENIEVRVGVMVSRSSEITSKCSAGDKELEFVEGKLLIYISRFENLGDELMTLQGLLPMFKIWWEVSEAEDTERELLEEALRDLQNLVEELARKRQEWRVHRARLDETMRWMSEVVEESETRVENLLKRIRSGHTSSAVDIPEGGPFRPAHYDDRIIDTVATILEHYVLDPASELRLADVSDVFARAKKVSRDTARKTIMAALLDSAVISAPGKPTFVRGLAAKEAAM